MDKIKLILNKAPYLTDALRINFGFQSTVCEACHDMTQKSISLDDFAIMTIGKNDYRVNFWFMTKSEAVNRMEKLI